MFSSGVPTGLPIAVVDQDHSSGSRELIRRLASMRGLAVTAQPPSLEAARTVVRSGAVYGIVHIPADWDRDRLRNASSPVVLYDNAQFSLVAGTIGGDVRAVVTSMAVDRLVASEARFGGGFAQAAMRVNGVQADLRTLFNPSLSYEAYFAGMLLPVALHLFCVIAAVSALGREFRDRSVDAWLASAGGSLPRALAGKLAPVALVYLLLSWCIVVTFAGWRGWAPAGSLVLWMVAIAVLMIVSVAIAIMLVGLTLNLRRALSLTGLYVATGLAFSGFSYPRAAMGQRRAVVGRPAALHPLPAGAAGPMARWCQCQRVGAGHGTAAVVHRRAVADWPAAAQPCGDATGPLGHPMTPWQALVTTVTAALRDRGLVIMFVAAVPFYSFFYPLPYATQSVRNVPLVVVDLDASPMSRDIVSRLSTVATVRIGGSASAVGEASGALAAGQIAGIVVVPENFSRDAARGTPTAVTVFGTGAYPVQDKAVLGSVGAVVQDVAGEVTAARLARQGAPAAALLQSARAGPAFIDQPLYNLTRGYGGYVVAAVGILIVQQVMLMAIAALVGTWLEQRAGTLFGSHAVGLGTLLGTIAGFALFVFLGAALLHRLRFLVPGLPARAATSPGRSHLLQ